MCEVSEYHESAGELLLYNFDALDVFGDSHADDVGLKEYFLLKTRLETSGPHNPWTPGEVSSQNLVHGRPLKVAGQFLERRGEDDAHAKVRETT